MGIFFLTPGKHWPIISTRPKIMRPSKNVVAGCTVRKVRNAGCIKYPLGGPFKNPGSRGATTTLSGRGELFEITALCL
jgi:hypothetical protein